MFRRIVCCLLICCLLFTTYGSIQVKATGLAGSIIGVAIEEAVGAILASMGVLAGPPGGGGDDFWDLVDRVIAKLPDSVKIWLTAGSMGMELLLQAVQYGSSIYFHQKVYDSVADTLFVGTETYDEVTQTVVTTAPIKTTKSFDSSVTVSPGVIYPYDLAMGYLYKSHPDVYEFAKTAPYCVRVKCTTDINVFVWSDSDIEVTVGRDGKYTLSNSINAVTYSVFVHPDGLYSLYDTMTIFQDGVLDIQAVFTGVNSYYTDKNLDISGIVPSVTPATYPSSISVLSEKTDSTTYPILIVIEDGQNPDDGSDKDPIPYYPVSLPSSKQEVETMTKEEAQSGTIAEPSISYDPVEDKVIDTNGDTYYWIAGTEVGVDLETAVGSILMALGISPGSSNEAFRQLVADVAAVIPSSMIYNYESLAYGEWPLLKGWFYDGKYYFSESVLTYINDLLYNGSVAMDPIFEKNSFDVDETVFTKYSEVCALLAVDYSTYDDYYKDAQYLCAIVELTGNKRQFYCFSSEPVTVSTSFYTDFTANGKFAIGDYGHTKTNAVSRTRSSTGSVKFVSMYDSPPSYVFTYELFERSYGAVIDVSLGDFAPSVNDLDYGNVTVMINNTALTFYPVTLSPSLDEIETKTQNVVRTGDDSSTLITVDVLTGSIVDVLPGIDVGDDDDVVVDPGINSGSGSNTNTGTDTGVDTDTPVVTPGGITLDDLDLALDTHGNKLLDGLKAFFEWLANTLTFGFRNIIEWLADTLLAGFGLSLDGLREGLLNGLKTLIDSLASSFGLDLDALGTRILEGVREIFVPSEDYLTSKVDALRAEFVFADAIITTGEFIGESLSGFGTVPPVIYIDLGATRGSYNIGGKVAFIDLTWYAEYKPMADLLLSALLWICFCWRVYVKLPGIISGAAGTFSYFTQHDD